MASWRSTKRWRHAPQRNVRRRHRRYSGFPRTGRSRSTRLRRPLPSHGPVPAPGAAPRPDHGLDHGLDPIVPLPRLHHPKPFQVQAHGDSVLSHGWPSPPSNYIAVTRGETTRASVRFKDLPRGAHPPRFREEPINGAHSFPDASSPDQAPRTGPVDAELLARLGTRQPFLLDVSHIHAYNHIPGLGVGLRGERAGRARLPARPGREGDRPRPRGRDPGRDPPPGPPVVGCAGRGRRPRRGGLVAANLPGLRVPVHLGDCPKRPA